MKMRLNTLLAGVAAFVALAGTPVLANPCAGADKTNAVTSPEAVKVNPCAAKSNPCAAKSNPCAAKANPCAAKASPCAAKADSSTAKASPEVRSNRKR
jgi:hypothetical protein